MKKLDLFYIRDSAIEATMCEEIDGTLWQSAMRLPYVKNEDGTVSFTITEEFMLDFIGQLNYAIM